VTKVIRASMILESGKYEFHARINNSAKEGGKIERREVYFALQIGYKSVANSPPSHIDSAASDFWPKFSK